MTSVALSYDQDAQTFRLRIGDGLECELTGAEVLVLVSNACDALIEERLDQHARHTPRFRRDPNERTNQP